MAYTTTITNAGRTLLASALAGEATINFSRVAIGSGDATGLTPASFADLVHFEINASIASNKRTGYYEVLNAVLTNDGVTTGFYMTEIGVYAKDPDNESQNILYAYIQITDGDGGKVPAASAASIRRRILLNAYVSTAVNVTVVLDSSLVYATMDDLTEHNEDSEAHENRFQNYQTRTDLLTEGDSIADGDSVPFYDVDTRVHKKAPWSALISKIRTTFFPQASGILKGDGSRNISAATAGTDYQQPTQILAAETAVADADTVPFYDASATGHRKTTWGNILTLIRTALFSNTSGILKANGSGVVSAATAGTDFQQATNILTTENDVATGDIFPIYDVSAPGHRKTTWGNIVTLIRTALFGTHNGLIKANGSGIINLATPGTDYQQATNRLTAESSLADADAVPFYDASATADRKTTWANLKSVLKTYFDSQYTKVIVDSSPTSGSANAISSGGVYTALSGKMGAVFYAGTSAPADTKLLWIDTTPTTGGLKYHNGSSWVRVPLAYSDVN